MSESLCFKLEGNYIRRKTKSISESEEYSFIPFLTTITFHFRLNLAMCYLKQTKWIEARNLCDKVLEENANVAKAYFRRGECLYNLNDHELGNNFNSFISKNLK